MSLNPYAQSLANRLRSWAQNEEMIDQGYTAHGCDCNTAADLIAAAPDLLAALVAALAVEQAHGQDWQPWAEQARAAIARAEGAI